MHSYCFRLWGFYMQSEAAFMKQMEVRHHQSGPALDRHTSGTDTDLTSLAVFGGDNVYSVIVPRAGLQIWV